MASYAQTVLADGPTGYWRCADLGVTSVDSVGGNNGGYGQVSGAYPIQGQPGALANEPSSSILVNSGTARNYWAYNASTAFQLTTPGWSIELWFKAIATSTSNQHILCQDYGAGGDTSWVIGLDTLANGSKLKVQTQNSAGAYTLIEPIQNFVDSVWHHVVVTLSSDGKTLNLYIDGINRWNQTYGTAITPRSPGAKWLLGGSMGGGGNYFFGNLSEIAIYTTIILSAAQVTNHYNSALASMFSTTQRIPGID